MSTEHQASRDGTQLPRLDVNPYSVSQITNPQFSHQQVGFTGVGNMVPGPVGQQTFDFNAEQQALNDGQQAFNSDRKTFDGDQKTFDGGQQTVNYGQQTFDGGQQTFDGGQQTVNGGQQAFNSDQQTFDFTSRQQNFDFNNGQQVFDFNNGQQVFDFNNGQQASDFYNSVDDFFNPYLDLQLRLVHQEIQLTRLQADFLNLSAGIDKLDSHVNKNFQIISDWAKSLTEYIHSCCTGQERSVAFIPDPEDSSAWSAASSPSV